MSWYINFIKIMYIMWNDIINKLIMLSVGVIFSICNDYVIL